MFFCERIRKHTYAAQRQQKLKKKMNSSNNNSKKDEFFNKSTSYSPNYEMETAATVTMDLFGNPQDMSTFLGYLLCEPEPDCTYAIITA